jgi:hypothetical protein
MRLLDGGFEREREGETDRERDRERDREGQRGTERGHRLELFMFCHVQA